MPCAGRSAARKRPGVSGAFTRVCRAASCLASEPSRPSSASAENESSASTAPGGYSPASTSVTPPGLPIRSREEPVEISCKSASRSGLKYPSLCRFTSARSNRSPSRVRYACARTACRASAACRSSESETVTSGKSPETENRHSASRGAGFVPGCGVGQTRYAAMRCAAISSLSARHAPRAVTSAESSPSASACRTASTALYRVRSAAARPPSSTAAVPNQTHRFSRGGISISALRLRHGPITAPVRPFSVGSAAPPRRRNAARSVS